MYAFVSLRTFIISDDRFSIPLFFQEPKQYVETLLGVHKKFHTVVVSAFKNEKGFVAALDKVCLLSISVSLLWE